MIFYCHIDFMTDWLDDIFIYSLVDWSIDWLIDWFFLRQGFWKAGGFKNIYSGSWRKNKQRV